MHELKGKVNNNMKGLYIYIGNCIKYKWAMNSI